MKQAAKDIETLEDIENLVNTFYGFVRTDKLLGPVFDQRIEDRWPLHLEKMVRFWETVLLEKKTYFGAPFPPHATLPISADHFERWLLLFYKAVNELFKGEIADEAKWRADKMAIMFQNKLNYYKNSKTQPLV